MKLYILFLLINIGFIILVNCIPPVKKAIDVNEEIHTGGYWKTKTEWKPYWVKNWVAKTVYIPIWKKIWGPINIKEWVPLPQPPPGWQQQ